MDRWRLGWDKENGVERDRHQSELTKRYKEMEVDRQKIETSIGGYIKNKER